MRTGIGIFGQSLRTVMAVLVLALIVAPAAAQQPQPPQQTAPQQTPPQQTPPQQTPPQQTPPQQTPPQQAGERTALLIPGKQTLQQRVITRPGAQLVRQVGAASGGAPQLPFSVFYVYGRQPAQGQSEWLEVGRSSRGQPDGWIRADQAIEWYQNLTLSFTNPAGRERVMFFRTRDDVYGLFGTTAGAERARSLRAEVAAGRGQDGPVIALEPEVYIDIATRFYLLPILQAERVTLQTGASSTLVEVASIPLTDDHAPVAPQQPDASAAMRNFTVGVAFVVDTTMSMDPYIERVRQSIRRVMERVRANPDLANRFRFALIGYRNSTRRVPALEYTARMFANFEDFRDPQRFMSQIDQVRATDVDSTVFDEDPIAGLRMAVEELKWEDFGGRYIIAFSDAGMRTASDPYSSTHLGPAEIRQLALSRGIATYFLHLVTPAGARAHDHERAQAQWSVITAWPNLGSLYFPVPEGSLSDFGRQVDDLTDNLVRQVTEATGAGVRPQQAPAPQPQPQPQQQPARTITEQTLLVGNAMRLAYLGRVQQAAAPPVIRAWTSDRDLSNPDIAAFDVRVLVTRNQLSDLSEVLRAILDQGNANRLRPADFFNQLRSAAANMTRNPARLRARDAQNLGDLMGEFLSDLPYRSEIMEIDQDQWLAIGAARQREVLDSIESKLRLYAEFEQRRDIWVSFDGGRVPGDAVYPMPLEALP
jgi:serine/threonine-protein kinase PpkA